MTALEAESFGTHTWNFADWVFGHPRAGFGQLDVSHHARLIAP